MTNAFTRRILKEVDFVSKTTKKEKKKQTERERENSQFLIMMGKNKKKGIEFHKSKWETKNMHA
jgi:hypothetical protein